MRPRSRACARMLSPSLQRAMLTHLRTPRSARAMAKKGAHVVMLNRPSERATAAEAALRAEAPAATITPIACDLQSFESVRACAEQLKTQFAATGLDVLANNAGVMALEDEATKDGFDVQMQTNHLSHFLLSREVMPLLEKAAELRGEARIVNHSSLARNGKPLDAKYLGPGGNLGGNGSSMIFGGARWQRYHQTKLANVVFTFALHDKLQAAGKSKIKVLCAAPGLAATNLQVTTHQKGGMLGADLWVMKLAQSADDGALPFLHCCVASGVESAEFFEPPGSGVSGPPTKKPSLSKECTDAKARTMLWEESEKACGPWKI
eukprot:Tamp_20775.p1 GENE.Tamp_20775~~Tamp_20775.p1  ORF type:complete len:321 (-),score=64.80 Tamp_20775:26-988(-)